MSYNPLLWKSFDLSDKPHQQLFLGQLTDLLQFLNSAQGLSTLLNGQGLLGSSSSTYQQINYGTITTNESTSVANAASVYVYGGVTTAFSPTINLTNLNPGTTVQMRFGNASSGTVTLKVTASNPTGTAYSVFALGTGIFTQLDTSGISLTTNQTFAGIGNINGGSLEFITVIP